ncbi:MAG: DUF805 domain-containing protein [Paracoccaceae bacterium]|jgi:uncharacterized membrane protein YhaH (DUF805 family)
MNFSEAVTTCFRKYVTFSGRASRSEYWFFFLFVLVLSLVANFIDWQFFTQVVSTETDSASTTIATSSRPIGSLVSLLVFLPNLAAAFRRMHDTGRSGLYALLPFLLTIGAAMVLIFGIGIASSFEHGGSLDLLFTRATLLVVIPTLVVLTLSPLIVLWWLTRPSQSGENSYGPNPHEVAQ